MNQRAEQVARHIHAAAVILMGMVNDPTYPLDPLKAMVGHLGAMEEPLKRLADAQEVVA